MVLPRTVDEVYNDFKGRRSALIKALTTDVDEFSKQCDPAEENLCLYGSPNEQWKLRMPEVETLPEIPEPTLGINFARDETENWLEVVAIDSDSWLLSVAFYFAAKFCFEKSERERLFSTMNDVPTVFDVVREAALKKKAKEKTLVSEAGSSKSAKYSETMLASEEDGGLEETEDEEEDALCGACGEKDTEDWEGFWIACDACNKWFHGKCVKMTRAKAKYIKHYNCPTCNRGPLA